MNHRWIPAKEIELVALCLKWRTVLASASSVETFHWIAVLCEGVRKKIETFLNAVDAYSVSDTSANRSVKNAAKKELISAMREFANSSVRYNPFVTEAVRLEMGLHTPDTVPTPQPRPISAPNVVATGTVTHFQHHVRALNPESGKAAKPAGVHGVRFAWQVGGERPAEGGAMNSGKFSRRPEIFVSHGEPNRGKMAYYAACYENAKGESGPWSPVVEAYIG
jgi:hypothetical protein